MFPDVETACHVLSFASTYATDRMEHHIINEYLAIL